VNSAIEEIPPRRMSQRAQGLSDRWADRRDPGVGHRGWVRLTARSLPPVEFGVDRPVETRRKRGSTTATLRRFR
jgi:hypothetical protein